MHTVVILTWLQFKAFTSNAGVHTDYKIAFQLVRSKTVLLFPGQNVLYARAGVRRVRVNQEQAGRVAR
jgi:hypothetical protein